MLNRLLLFIFWQPVGKQWGYLPKTSSDITFPIPFPTAVYSVQSNAYNEESGNGGYERHPYSATKTKVNIAYQSQTSFMMYIALGN